MNRGEKFIIGVDTGGTFTDCVVMNEEGVITIGKSPSTPEDFSIGILNSIKVAAESLGMTVEDVLKRTILFAHGTTIATNVMITHSGAKTGLITTKGFEDTILIMRAFGRMAGLSESEITHIVNTNKPKAIVPKSLIEGVIERIDYRGNILCPLDIQKTEKIIKIFKDKGVEAIAVSLLWSFKNPEHELEIEKIIKELYPELFVSLSSNIAPILGEYERTSTTVINAYLQPVMNNYLTSLRNKLKRKGLDSEPLIMQAYGGSLPIMEAIKKPVGTISSGPVGGIIGSKYLAELMGYKNVIVTDVGGTSFDVGLIYEGIPEYARDSVINQYNIASPMLEVKSIGAAAGSIAWIEQETNILMVGPNSAGAVPGPICYDMGGTEPTVTDADLILGYLNPNYFIGGRMKLDKERSIQYVKEKIANKLGMDVVESAAGIYAIINAHMADLIRKVTIERGYDPRNFVLFAYGGAGPVHAGSYGEDLETIEIVIPSTASVHSAMGILASDIIHTYELSDPMVVPVDVDRVNQIFESLEQKGIEDLFSEGFKENDISIFRYVDMRYRRQVHEIRVPVPLKKLTSVDLEVVIKDFEILYEKSYGKGSAFREAGMEMITFRIEAMGKLFKPSIAKYDLSLKSPLRALKTKREVFFNKYKDFILTRIYDFGELQPGNIIEGPAIIETPVTTIVVNPDQIARVDRYKNVIIKYNEYS